MSSSRRHLLWIDDEIDLLQSHLMYLKDRGFDVTCATNGTDALSLIRERGFDLVLLDEMMPVMNGLEVLRRIKSIRPELPVIMVTQNEAESLMEEAIGSQISGYLTKPVNPSQILSALKGILDRRELSVASVTRNWAQTFAELSRDINDAAVSDDWLMLHQKLCAWEISIDELNEPQLGEMIRAIRLEADRMFARWIEDNYPQWILAESGRRPPLSMDVCDRWLIPILAEVRPTLFLVVDCLRMDQYLALEPVLAELFDLKREAYFSILPSATPFARNALFSGLNPAEIERVHPTLWSQGDEDEASSNRFERQFLADLLKRRGLSAKYEPKYIKVIDIEELAEAERRVNDLLNHPLTAMVYNFVDILIHTRQSVEVLQEIFPDESAFRAVTRAWFRHSALYRILQAFARAGGTVILTSDHGSVRVRRGAQVIGDRTTSTGLRYKYGSNLQVDNKTAFRIRNPQSWGLPRRGVNTEYILAHEDYFLLFPTNYHRYFDFYRGSFQHGGVSLDEMALPVVTMQGKK